MTSIIALLMTLQTLGAAGLTVISPTHRELTEAFNGASALPRLVTVWSPT